MKKTILLVAIFLSATIQISAQIDVKSIVERNSLLVVNDSILLEKNSHLQIYLPVSRDFLFIKEKKKFDPKILGKVANIVGSGAAVVGMSSGNTKVLTGVYDVMRTANAVEYGANALGRIQELPISNESKKIAGKKIQIQDWKFTSDGYILTGLIDKKKYDIYLQEALITGEISLK